MILRRMSAALVTAGGIISLSVALAYAQRLGIVDAGSATRAMQVVIGLVLAAYSNFMPKRGAQACGADRDLSRAQAARRVGGWSMTLAGLGYAGLWAFAPIAVAAVASTILVATALLITLAFSGRALLHCWSGAVKRGDADSHSRG